MSKGARRERQAVDLYQRAGMGTYRPATVKFGENDVFGLFDLLAFSPRHRCMHAVSMKAVRLSPNSSAYSSMRARRLLAKRMEVVFFCVSPISSKRASQRVRPVSLRHNLYPLTLHIVL